MADRAALLGLLLAFSVSFACGQEENGQIYGFVSFSEARVEVQEDSGNAVTTVQLPMVREVGSTGTILATVQVRLCILYDMMSVFAWMCL